MASALGSTVPADGGRRAVLPPPSARLVFAACRERCGRTSVVPLAFARPSFPSPSLVAVSVSVSVPAPPSPDSRHCGAPLSSAAGASGGARLFLARRRMSCVLLSWR